MDAEQFSHAAAAATIQRARARCRGRPKAAQTNIPGLLPADVGLVLLRGWVILEFGARPFDPIELDRMLPLVKQIAERLPTLEKAAAK